MKTIRDQIEENMSSNNISGTPEDFLQAAADFLQAYSEHMEFAEPNATNSIRRYADVSSSLNFLDDQLDEPIQG